MKKLILILALCVPCFAQDDLLTLAGPGSKGLVGRWDLYGGGGTPTSSTTTEKDLSGYGRTATWSGTKAGGVSGTYYSAVSKAGLPPFAGYFDGSTDYLTTSSLSGSALPAATVSLWAAAGTSGEIFASFSGGGWIGDFNGSGKYVCDIGTAAAEGGTTTTSWTMVTCTASSTTQIAYVNGVSVASQTSSGSTVYGSVFIGNYQGSGFWTSGNLAFVRIWNFAMTPAQVANLYLAQTSELMYPNGPWTMPDRLRTLV